jgi:formylmethanofuran dehydrogenase subunit E
MELETKVETYRIDKQCDKCKEGLMHSTGKGITQWHSSWEHKCDKCGEIVWYENKSYPATGYRDVGKTKERKD